MMTIWTAKNTSNPKHTSISKLVSLPLIGDDANHRKDDDDDDDDKDDDGDEDNIWTKNVTI